MAPHALVSSHIKSRDGFVYRNFPENLNCSACITRSMLQKVPEPKRTNYIIQTILYIIYILQTLPYRLPSPSQGSLYRATPHPCPHPEIHIQSRLWGVFTAEIFS